MRGERRIKPKAFIICNGTETEYNYFSGLRSYLGREGNYLMDVKTVKGDPINMIQQLLKGKLKLKHYDKELDGIFIVFDVDDFYTQNPESFITIINKTIKNGIYVIYTNPCFEYWLLLHLKKTYSTLDANKTNESLKKAYKKVFSSEYRKNMNDIYTKFVPYESLAIERSTKFEGPVSDIEKSITINPSTRVNTLIKILKDPKDSSK